MANTYNLQLSSAAQQYCYQAAASSFFSITGAKTIEAWIKFTTSFTNKTILSKWDNGPGTGQGFCFEINSDNEISFRASDSGSNEFGYNSASFTLNPNTCYHVAAVFDGAGHVSFYRNGLLTNTVNSVSNTYNNSNVLFRIGAIGTNPGIGNLFDGTLDEIRFWNVVRSDSDIANNYLRELGGNESGLIGYWKLNNNYSDSTSNGNTLSVSGLPVFTSNVCFTDNTTTSTSTTSTSTSSSTTTTSTSTTSTSTSSSTSTSRTTSTSTTSTITTTSTTTTSTSTTSTSTSTTSTSSSTTTTTSTSTSTTITMDLRLIVEKAK